MRRTVTVSPSGHPQLVERFASDEEIRDLQGASRLYRRDALPDKDDRTFSKETEAAGILQAAAELKGDFGVEPLRLLRRTCRAEEQLRGFIEGRRGERIEGPPRLSREEILWAMAVTGLWDSPTLRQAVDGWQTDVQAERRFLRDLGSVFAHRARAIPDRPGTVLLMLDDDFRSEGKDLATVLAETGGTVAVDGRPEIKESNASAIGRKLRRIRKQHGLSRPRGRPKKKTDT